ncbi:MAG: DUF349 domain-containing protein [Cyclobacteriaceae bacterium]|nr:DUF349 domain-containing protein [Cyclobacteriaceae bacterium]
MENEMDLHTEQKNNSEELTQEPQSDENSSRKGRDSSINSENNLDEEESHVEEQDDDNSIDYSNFSKEQLASVVKELTNETNFSRIDSIIKEVRPLFNGIRNKEKAAALEKFIAEGGVKDDFDYKGDTADHDFDATVKLLRSKKNKYFKEQEDQKNENLAKKNAILEKLRALADGEDTENSFSEFKQLQKEWKSIGQVPNSHSRTLWANYTALLDLYYDQRSIYFELKELDRKKNLEYKWELCERAEKLAEEESIKVAVKELNELHEEFKHTGPVPREEKDNVWNRFKAASDAVYAKRDSHMAELHETFKKNLEVKKLLIEELGVFVKFESDRIKEWNNKTKEILALQKRWEAVGPVPRNQIKETNRLFWSSFKSFFANKGNFFKKLDGEREKNIELKKELIAKANSIKDSTDWENASEELKRLQHQWKDIGPVPEKQREKIYKEFKTACDEFFEKRREQFGKQDEEQGENLKLKKELCDLLEKHAAEKSGTNAMLHETVTKFNNIGFVPRKAIKSIKSRFDKAVAAFIASLPEVGEEEKDRLAMEVQLVGLKNDPQGERKIHHKEQSIKTQIHKAENDIAILRNNMEFFGRSKNAEKLKGEFAEKLEVAASHLSDLKKQLKLLKTV